MCRGGALINTRSVLKTNEAIVMCSSHVNVSLSVLPRKHGRSIGPSLTVAVITGVFDETWRDMCMTEIVSRVSTYTSDDFDIF